MATTIPDLWSDNIKVDVLTPLVILRSQASYLESKTQGLLRAKVFTTSTDQRVQHQLDLIAPALNQYRKTVLTAQHEKDLVYPVVVDAPADMPTQFAMNQDEFLTLLRNIFQSKQVQSLIHALIAQSNEVRSGTNSEGEAEDREGNLSSRNDT